MSKRLQVLVPDDEYRRIQRTARQARLSVGEWVRQNLRDALGRKPVRRVEEKLASIRRAALHNGPTANIDQMLREIERIARNNDIQRSGHAQSLLARPPLFSGPLAHGNPQRPRCITHYIACCPASI